MPAGRLFRGIREGGGAGGGGSPPVSGDRRGGPVDAGREREGWASALPRPGGSSSADKNIAKPPDSGAVQQPGPAGVPPAVGAGGPAVVPLPGRRAGGLYPPGQHL